MFSEFGREFGASPRYIYYFTNKHCFSAIFGFQGEIIEFRFMNRLDLASRSKRGVGIRPLSSQPFSDTFHMRIYARPDPQEPNALVSDFIYLQI